MMRSDYPTTILVWYCQFDVSPVNYSDSDQLGHFMLDTKSILNEKYANPFYAWVHLEIGGVQQGWCGRLKVGFPSSGTCVQKWVG